METKLSKEVRAYLEWSWNYTIAEWFCEETVRHIAQEIASGIARGEDASDKDLVAAWLSERVDDLNGLVVPDEWDPDLENNHITPEDFRNELVAQPYFSRLFVEEKKIRKI